MRIIMSAALLSVASTAALAAPYTLPVTEARPFAELKQDGVIVCASYREGVDCDVPSGVYELYLFTPSWSGTKSRVSVADATGERDFREVVAHTHMSGGLTCDGATDCRAACPDDSGLFGVDGPFPEAPEFVIGGSCSATVDGRIVPTVSITGHGDILEHVCLTAEPALIDTSVSCAYPYFGDPVFP